MTIQRKDEEDPMFTSIDSSSAETEEISLYFEDKAKCIQTKQFIDYNRSNGEELRNKAIERFLES